MDSNHPLAIVQRCRAEALVKMERQSYQRSIAEVQRMCLAMEKYTKDVPVWNLREKYYDWYTGYTMARMIGRMEGTLYVLCEMDHADVQDLYDELELMLMSATHQYRFMLNRMMERNIENRSREKRA